MARRSKRRSGTAPLLSAPWLSPAWATLGSPPATSSHGLPSWAFPIGHGKARGGSWGIKSCPGYPQLYGKGRREQSSLWVFDASPTAFVVGTKGAVLAASPRGDSCGSRNTAGPWPFAGMGFLSLPHGSSAPQCLRLSFLCPAGEPDTSPAPSSPSRGIPHPHKGGEGRGRRREHCHCVSDVWPPVGDPHVTAALALEPVC